MSELDSKALEAAIASLYGAVSRRDATSAITAYLSALPAPATQEVTSYEIVDQTGCLHVTTDPKHAEELRQALIQPELREDTARLDWLEMHYVSILIKSPNSNELVEAWPHGLTTPSDLRAQIDRARAAEKDKG